MKVYSKNKLILIILSAFFTLSIKPNQPSYEMEAFQYCLSKVALAIKKTLKDGTIWSAAPLIYFVDAYSSHIFQTQCMTTMGGVIGSIIKHSYPKSEYKQLNLTAAGSVVKTALDCPFATMYLLATVKNCKVNDGRENYIAGVLVAFYLGWNFFDNYFSVITTK